MPTAPMPSPSRPWWCRPAPVLLGLVLAIVLPGARAAQAGAADSAWHWVHRMARAERTLNFRGTFVYQHGDRLEAMRIVHQGGRNGGRERLYALTGPAREVLRDARSVTCILPDRKAVMVDKRLPRRPFERIDAADAKALDRFYDIRLDPDDRVADKMTRVISIVPRDGFRYGYRFYVDRRTGLMLKSVVNDHDGHVLEQLMFTAMEVPDRIDESELRSALPAKGYHWYGHPRAAGDEDAVPARHSPWRVTWVPAGFRLTHHNQHAVPMRTEKVEHMVYSDGLATVSIYFEPLQQAQKAFTGTSSMGAVHAVGRRLNGFQVTVVGLVPEVTVARMGAAVEYRPAAATAP